MIKKYKIYYNSFDFIHKVKFLSQMCQLSNSPRNISLLGYI